MESYTIRQESFQHSEDYPFYTLYKHQVLSTDTHAICDCYSVLCEYGDHTFNLFTYTDLESAERIFNRLVDHNRYESA